MAMLVGLTTSTNENIDLIEIKFFLVYSVMWNGTRCTSSSQVQVDWAFYSNLQICDTCSEKTDTNTCFTCMEMSSYLRTSIIKHLCSNLFSARMFYC